MLSRLPNFRDVATIGVLNYCWNKRDKEGDHGDCKACDKVFADCHGIFYIVMLV